MDRFKVGIVILLGVVLGWGSQLAYSAEVIQKSPIGFWKTIDDATGKPKSIVQIWATPDKVLMGKVIKVFAKQGDKLKVVCSECSGDLHNKPIVGMVILSGLKQNNDHWNQGEITDPHNGKTYDCSLKMADNGQKLNVHGFVGLPLFGRSQTWVRVDLMSDNN